MKILTVILILLVFNQPLSSQPNCLMLKEDSCKQACELSIKASKYQGSKYSQELFDKAIELCPTFAYAYYEKSVPYLKHGIIREWKELIDKAVELEPQTYLLNRGCNQIQFLRNYKNGIKDLDKLQGILGYFNIGHTNSGEYHAQLLKAIAHRKIGEVNKSIEIMEVLINDQQYYQGMFDFLHIGISYLEAQNLNAAKSAFDRQIEENEIAELYYYYAQVYEKENNNELAMQMLIKAKDIYEKGQMMKNNYYNYIDKIFLADIERYIERLTSKTFN